jgi:uncharacterized protein YcfJ
MRATLLTLALLASVSVSQGLQAQTVEAQVVDYRPVIVQYYNTRTECYTVPAHRQSYYIYDEHPRDKTLAGTVLGAGLGYLVDGGSGAAIGALGGALVGHHAQRHRHQRVHPRRDFVRVCEPVTDFHDRISHWSVDYLLDGTVYTTRLDYEPGATIYIRLSHEVVR